MAKKKGKTSARSSNNKALLYELLQIYSPSYEEEAVADVIIRELTKIGGFDIKKDIDGNVYAVRGQADSYPLLNAHMDIVDLSYSFSWSRGASSKSSKSYYDMSYYDKIDYYDDTYSTVAYLVDSLGTDILSAVVGCEDCISGKYCWGDEIDGELCPAFCPTLKAEDRIMEWATKYGLLDDMDANTPLAKETYSISEQNGKIKGSGQYRVLGGDDKCGIFIALEVARQTDTPMKLLFTVAEEIGCMGVDAFIKHNKAWFKDVKYSLTIDRKGGDHLLMSQLGVQSCSKGFGAKVAMAGIMEGIPVKVMDGSLSDVVSIRDLVKNSVNMSAGYYDPHSEDEYIVWEDVKNIIKWVKRIVLDKNI